MTEEFQAPGARVLITGGTSGLGAAMAAALMDAGAAVAITGRDPERTEAVARELGPGCIGVAMDARAEDDVEHGVGRVVDALGGLDLLVNNAGLGMRTVNPRFLTDPQPFWAVPPDGFRDVVDTNLTGYFLVARSVVPRFLTAGSGRVVTISMNHSTMNRKGFVPYGPARAGAEALSRIMAADLDGTGVTVNILLPGGATATGMIPDDFPPEHRGQLLDPAIMGPPIRFLASAAAAGVHDERIVATEFENWLAGRLGSESTLIDTRTGSEDGRPRPLTS
ncbi:MAG TPA: SDR family oxidoreductase [Blastococcus sp.]|nr:SDR family oxidoreductase [Blastococcus sp.]